MIRATWYSRFKSKQVSDDLMTLAEVLRRIGAEELFRVHDKWLVNQHFEYIPEPADDATREELDAWQEAEDAAMEVIDAEFEKLTVDEHLFCDLWNEYSDDTTAPEGVYPKWYLEVVEEDQ